ncbi:MAG: hypothetical protein DDG60_07455 [Anaerolineae bacterium]|nr:MAG: hypothetical protein DDG60_07455 [Anaerolineae bacterium]
MKRFGLSTLFGLGLILLGGLMLLEKINVLRNASGFFAGLVFLAAAAYFAIVLIQDPRQRWWAAFPATALLGMAGAILLPESFSKWTSGLFLGTLGFGFFLVYFLNRTRWWAILPGGILLTLAGVATLTEFATGSGYNTASFFFFGLGFTFLLVALLPNPQGTMRWAYIPAIALLLMGGLLSSQATARLIDYVWPAALILSGILVIVGFFKNQN